jgi:hypothetical protein
MKRAVFEAEALIGKRPEESDAEIDRFLRNQGFDTKRRVVRLLDEVRQKIFFFQEEGNV